MSLFAQRIVNLKFTKDGYNIDLTGLQVHAVIQSYLLMSQLELRVFGMTLGLMNNYTSAGISNGVYSENIGISVSAGDQGSVPSLVFEGTLIRSFIEFNPPAASLYCSATAQYQQSTKANAQYQKAGPQNAENIIQALAQQAGLGFQNNGAHAVLTNQYLAGSVIDQMTTVARAAKFPIKIENNTVYIWGNGGYRDQTVVTVSPSTGLVGYPSYWEAGFTVKTQFNPQIVMGRQIVVQSSLPQANGAWAAMMVTHELSTIEPGGPWFTTTQLSPPDYVAAN